MRLVHEHRHAVLDAPAGEADAERTPVGQDLVRPLVPRPDRNEDAAGLVRLVDRQRVVRNQLGEGVGDPVQERVEALLGEDVVEDVRQPLVRLDARVVGRKDRLGRLADKTQGQSVVEIVRNTSSPAPWPKTSLTRLKSSMSSMRSDTESCDPLAAVSASRRYSWKARWL